jgi:hypothetical protein
MTKKKEPPTSGIVLPAGAPAWAQDRVKLWSEAERCERNNDALNEFIARMDENIRVELNRQRKPRKGLSVTVHGCFDFADFPAGLFNPPES